MPVASGRKRRPRERAGGRAATAADPTTKPQQGAWPAAGGITRGKRAVDIVISAALLVVLLPVLFVTALIVKAGSRGPVLFRQTRLGYGQRPFTVLKFRTMRPGASSAPHRDYLAAICNEDGHPVLWKLTNDPRLVPGGSLLRRLSLDELPQLINVLRGEMSLVGPRPALDYELEFYEDRHYERFAVRPGLTGLWQVSGRARVGYREMLDLDVRYAHSVSPRMDAQILLRTPAALLPTRTA